MIHHAMAVWGRKDWWKALLPLCAIAFLWFRLIDHLRIEWSVNPQYSYGWAVPFLCLYLLWNRAKRPAGTPPDAGESIGEPEARVGCDGNVQRSTSNFKLSTALLVLCALLYAPTRLIQEANPEWRLVSWALALEVVGLTLILGARSQRSRNTEHALAAPKSDGGGSRLAFPVLFFLVAVPWPTLLEGPLIQGLTRTNAATTIEVLNVLGIPAIQHGNTIEVGAGVVGIDDACSGIRSFQAALMISLFLGELYRLSALRRSLLCLMGFGFSFLFNIARTTLLTSVAAHRGTAAIGTWHDPAGIIILVGCFLSLWMLALALATKRRREPIAAEQQLKGPEDNRGIREIRGKGTGSGLLFRVFRVFRGSLSIRTAVCLLLWLALVEGGTELWYRWHELRLPKAVAWQVELPRANATFRDAPFSEKTKQFLRYDEGLNGAWQEEDGTRWQAIFLRWNPGRIAVHLAKSHTPEVCLTASGREVVSQAGLRPVTVHALQLPFRSYVMKEEGCPVHVFYCLWEDRADSQFFRTTALSYANRLAPVLAGRRNCGQRSLEVAIRGVDDAGQAEAALRRQLERLIRVPAGK